MSKNRDEEKVVDAVVVEDDAGNEKDQVQETTKEESKRRKRDKVMEAGQDVPTVAGPSVVMVNRAAIVYLAKHLLAPPDLEDFKIAFPSLF